MRKIFVLKYFRLLEQSTKIFTVNFCDRKQLVVGEQFASQDSLLVPVHLHYFQSKKPLIWKRVKDTAV